MILCIISSWVGVEYVFVYLAHTINMEVYFIGGLYYNGTKNTMPSAFENIALAEAVARLIGNIEVPGIEAASVSS